MPDARPGREGQEEPGSPHARHRAPLVRVEAEEVTRDGRYRLAAGLDARLAVNADLGGLIRLERASGVQVWQCPDAFRFVSCNRKYVYATDKNNHLLVIDRAKGTVMANYDASAYPISVANDTTGDREPSGVSISWSFQCCMLQQ